MSITRDQIADDAYLFIGNTYGSNSTIFVRDGEALLIETTASTADAEALRDYVEGDLRKTVKYVVLTHYFSDHMAGARCFPRSSVVAHRHYAHTFDSERFRLPEAFASYVEPAIEISDELTIRWGKHTLRIFYNPGHTMSTLNVDIAECDLLHVSDTAVGRLAYIAYSTPSLIREAVGRARATSRSRIVASHENVRSASDLDHVLRYLDRLKDAVRSIRNGDGSNEDILKIAAESCFDPDLTVSEFERFFHQRNLGSILERALYSIPSRGGD